MNFKKEKSAKEKHIAEVCEATGWSKEKSEKELKKAKKAGMPYYRYVKYQCWTMNFEDIVKLNESVEAEIQAKRKPHIESVCKKTGWSEEEAVSKMNKADKLGVTFRQYDLNNAFELDEKGLEKLAESIKNCKTVTSNKKSTKEGHIDEVCEATGWSREKAEEELNKAKAAGMPYYRYIKNKCWTMEFEDIVKLNESVEAEIQAKRKPHIESVCKKTGWSEEEAVSKMNTANKLGVTFRQYDLNNAFELDEKGLKELAESIKNRKTVTSGKKSTKEGHIDKVCDATGWSREKAEEELNKAKEAGMPYYRYIKNKCWTMEPDEIVKLNASIEEGIRVRRQPYIDDVCQKTGWSEEEAVLQMEDARRAGISYKKYSLNNVQEFTEEEVKAFAEKIKQDKIDRDENKKEFLNVVIEETGWSEEKASKELDKAKAAGMPYHRYIKYRCWEDDKNISEINEQVEKRLSTKINDRVVKVKEIYVEYVCEHTGWDENTALEKMHKARAMDVQYRDFAMKHLYDLTDEELKEYGEEYKKNQKLKKKNYEFYVDAVCKKTGWDHDTAAKKMETAKKSGVSYLKYIQKELWDADNPEREIKLIISNKKRLSDNKKVYVERIQKETGWTVGKVELEVLKAKNVCEASYEDFLVYKFYNKTPEEQAKYVTLGMFNKMRIKYNSHKVSAMNFDNKAKFNENFNEFVNHKWFVNENMTYEEFLENIEGLNKIIVKPLAATQGIGIQVFQCNVSEEENKKLYDTLFALPRSIVEEYIIQHPEIAKFCSTSVNTIRVMTLNYNGECKFLYSVFRMGAGGVVDNFHAGGVAASVDLETGVVYSNAATLNGDVYTHSPATNIKIKGFQIPNWDKIRETCIAISGKIPGTDLVGWDFAITEKGVDLIEGNPGASYIVAQIPNVEDNIGLAETMALPYI